MLRFVSRPPIRPQPLAAGSIATVVMLLVLGMLAAPASAAPAAVAPASAAPLAGPTAAAAATAAAAPTAVAVPRIALNRRTDGLSQQERAVLGTINAERAHRGLRPLAPAGGTMQTSARRWSDSMSRTGQLRHDLERLQRLLLHTRRGLLRENLAAVPGGGRLGPAVNRLWLDSPSHRETLLDPQVRRAGVGIVTVAGVHYVTLDLSD